MCLIAVVTFSFFTCSSLVRAAKVQAAGGGGAEAEIALPANGDYSIEYAADGKSILVVSGRRLFILSGDGRTRVRSAELAKPYRRLHERKDHYVAITSTTYEVIDKATLVPARSINLRCIEAYDLAIHPARLVSFVSLTEEPPTPLPRMGDQRIVLIDENTLATKRPAQLYGRWLAMDPEGRRLFAGVSGFVSAPLTLDLELPRDLAEADFPLDLLMALNLDDAGGAVQSVSVNPRAGATGRAVRIAPDGKLISYVSRSGTPPLSHEIPAFDSQAIDRVVATYAMNEMGDITDVAFHPTLPLVAASAQKGVLLFHRETGQRLEARLAFGDAPPTDPRRLFWSPDGRTLLIDVSEGDSRVLRAHPLTLTPADQQSLRPPPP